MSGHGGTSRIPVTRSMFLATGSAWAVPMGAVR